MSHLGSSGSVNYDKDSISRNLGVSPHADSHETPNATVTCPGIRTSIKGDTLSPPRPQEQVLSIVRQNRDKHRSSCLPTLKYPPTQRSSYRPSKSRSKILSSKNCKSFSSTQDFPKIPLKTRLKTARLAFPKVGSKIVGSTGQLSMIGKCLRAIVA
jgi:hypothetical protein